MTKFIVRGGAVGQEDDSQEAFFSEMLKGLSDGANILLVYFAIEPEKWGEHFILDEERFEKAGNGVRLKLIVARESSFLQQVKDADLIYLRGGRTQMLQDVLKQFPSLGRMFEKKIIAGSSAGACVLARFYADNDRKDVFSGLGMLPYKICVHYKEDTALVKKLEAISEELPLMKLPEGEFQVIEQ